MHPEAERCLNFLKGLPREHLLGRLEHIQRDINAETERRSSWAIGKEYCIQEMAYWNRKEQAEVYRGKHLNTIKHFEAWERLYSHYLSKPDPRKWMQEVVNRLILITSTDSIPGEESIPTPSMSPTDSVTATAVSTLPAAGSVRSTYRKARFIDD